MKQYLIAFGLCTLMLGILDALWLGFATKKLYAPLMGDLLRLDIQMLPAALFYLLFAFGLSAIIIIPAMNDNNIMGACIKAAIFGFVAYGTYNFTTWAIIANLNPLLVAIDMIWGASAATITSFITLTIIKKMGI
jgi:uncharacterized membrane protein